MDQNLLIEQNHFFLNQQSAVKDVNFRQTLQRVGTFLEEEEVLTCSESSKIVFH